MMQMFTIYHNPRCSKSRAALALLQAHGHAPIVRDYLESPLTDEELSGLLSQLQLPLHALMRPQEALYRELGLHAGSAEATLRSALSAHPQLLERPIVSAGGKAVIARPAEQLLALFAGAPSL